MSSMLGYTFFQLIMTVAIFAICLLLMMIILIQKGRGGGLSSAFGGGGGGGGAFGAKTGDVFTGITVVLAGIYLLLTVFGNYVLRPDTGTMRSAAVQAADGGAAPGAPATGATGAAPATGPQQLPPNAIRLNTDTASKSIGKAIEEGQQAAPTGSAAPTGEAAPTAAPAEGGAEGAAAPSAETGTAPAEGAAPTEETAPAGEEPTGDQG